MVCAPRKDEDLAAPVAGYLQSDMCRGTETKESKMPAGLYLAQA
jgi:hypothetical protein